MRKYLFLYYTTKNPTSYQLVLNRTLVNNKGNKRAKIVSLKTK